MEDELIDKILEDVAFEKKFYEIIAETDNYNVIPIEGSPYTPLSMREEVELKALEAQCERSGIKILYRISYGTYAVVVCKDNINKVGIIPETNPDGWPC